MSRTYIPPELCQQVLAASTDDKRSLQTCSLVCWSWREFVHGYLFERIAVAYAPNRTFEDFVAFLAARPKVAASIKDLKLIGTASTDMHNVDRCVFSRGTLTNMLSKLCALKRLSFCDFHFHASMVVDGVGTQERTVPVPLERLEVSNTHFHGRDAVLASLGLLSLFATDVLHLSGLRFKYDDHDHDHYDDSGLDPVPIKILVLDHIITDQDIMFVLDAIISRGSIQMMSFVSPEWPVDAYDFGLFLRLGGRHIKVLELNFSEMRVVPSNRPSWPTWQRLEIAFGTLEHLEVLSLTGVPPEACVGLLPPLENAKLQKFVLSLELANPEQFNDGADHWAEMDRILTRRRFPNLKSVTLVFTRAYGASLRDCFAAAAIALHASNEAGLLKLENVAPRFVPS